MQHRVAGYGRRKSSCKFGVKSGCEEGVGCLTGAEELMFKRNMSSSNADSCSTNRKEVCRLKDDYLLLMEPQGQIKSISIAVVQAGGQYALEHSSNLLLDPFNADRHEHICQRNSSRSVENCRQEEKEGHV